MIDQEQSTANAYFQRLSGAVVNGVTGKFGNLKISEGGLVTMFFEVMVKGILQAERQKMLFAQAMKIQSESINKMFDTNLQNEKEIEAQIASDLETEYINQRNAVDQAIFVHILIGVIFLLIVAAILFYAFPRRK